MGILDKLIDKDKTSQMTIANPRDVFHQILKNSSGYATARDVKYNIFYQIIAFKGVKDGVGVSTIVANTAIALAELGLTVCVIDTSILYPTQDILLKTNMENYDKKDIVDWLDMPFTKASPLHVSSINKNISVLGFYGKDRGIVDLLSTNDSDSLVELAITEFHNKFDIILMDVCDEPTEVCAGCMQQSQKVIQVWNDSPQVMGNINAFLTNWATLACPLDKMKNVVFSKLARETMGANLDAVLEEYKLRKITESYLDEDIYFHLATNKVLYQLESRDEDIIKYTDMIVDIVAHILNLNNLNKKVAKGTITSQDIMDGKVEGTTTKKLKDRADAQGYNTVVSPNSTDEMNFFE